MYDLRKFYENENAEVMASYEDTLRAIERICGETGDRGRGDSGGNRKKYYEFFNRTGNMILGLADREKKLGPDYISSRSFAELLEENNRFDREILPDEYGSSFANPAYGVKVFGDGFGQLLSYFHVLFRQFITMSTLHKIFVMEEYNRLFIDTFEYVKAGNVEYDPLKELITRIDRQDKTRKMVFRLRESFDREFAYFRDIVMKADLDDPRYMFLFGEYITDNEIKTARFLSSYPDEKISGLAEQIAKSYVNGFMRENKDISKKSTVLVVFKVGQERIIRPLVERLKEQGLEILINHISSTRVNKQYEYDHRFDNALYLSGQYVDSTQKNFRDASQRCREMLAAFSGNIVFGKFGEPPFAPENKVECLKLSEEQQKLFQAFQDNFMRIHEEYLPSGETSFTVVSFPAPEIGENYERIFEDILEINTLDTERYERIQQTIIDALDRADYVHVKGRGENQTDLMVRMQQIRNPEKETNFLNCGALINIPVGEVYTTPQLTGTNGILHVEEAFLGGLKFVNLKLTMQDGFVRDYSCDNFPREEDNRKYIEENLFFPHKTLPMGEFAIGTNTLAYMVAKKHGIMNVLPVLIIEKMGPHFAIGDTCFSREEDKPVYNALDNKEITARENEKTALRETNPREAYTHRHTDITIPYESIHFIAAITREGERIDIIRDGKFALEGTEELNEPLD